MLSDEHGRQTPRKGFIKPWEFWVMFFAIFALGVLLGLYGQSTGNDALLLVAILGTAALLTAYTHRGSQWVISND